ncbi:MAG: agmatinase [Thermotogae bacterium]|nr:agmatinase [Thermotogota bacterium]
MEIVRTKLLGIQYEGKENFLGGTRIAPAYIRWALESIEDYSPYLDGFYKPYKDLGDFYAKWDWPASKFSRILESCLRKKLDPRDRMLFLGGDHFITYPIVRALRSVHGDFIIFQLDAHLDRRDQFEGSKFNHATVMRRLEEDGFRVYTFGYRAFAKGLEYTHDRTFPFDVLEPMKATLREISSPIYLTLDVDVLDPSIMPSVTNPEGGGASFKEILEAINLLKGRLIGADLVEFSPVIGDHYKSGVNSAILVRELLVALKYSAS